MANLSKFVHPYLDQSTGHNCTDKNQLCYYNVDYSCANHFYIR